MRVVFSSAGRVGLSLIAALFLFSVALPATALTIDSTSGGLGLASGCSDPACFDVLYDTVTNSGTASGSLSVSGSVLDFSIQLDGASLGSTGGDGRVAGVVFHVTYTGQVTVSLDPANNFVIDPGQSAQITGIATPIGAGSPVAINATSSLLTGVCSGNPAGALQCGLIFSPTSDFEAVINGNVRYFEHTVNVFAAVPEPGTAVLMGLGLGGLAGVRRRSRNAA